ncbi:MAG: hypothetical protein IJT49_00755 [Clostridia bacterium]|nr:hypothetical protein [Clostridia bacterium]
MSNKKLYNAMGKIDDDMIKDALETDAVKEKNFKLRYVLQAVACAALVCGFVALSLVLQKISKPSDNNIAASSGSLSEIMPDQTVTAADTEKEAETEDSELSKALEYYESAKEWNEHRTPEDEIDHDVLAEWVEKIYDHPGTSKTQFRLLDKFDTSKYRIADQFLIAADICYDEAYDPEIAYSQVYNEPVWYKPPYVRYHVAGFPDGSVKEKYVIHTDVCGDDTVTICGINVNSSFEEFEKTFTELGFNVHRGTMDLPYAKGRQIIEASYNGLWIILEKEAQYKPFEYEVYNTDQSSGYRDYVGYDNDTVPAILRMGVVVKGTKWACEQYDMP